MFLAIKDLLHSKLRYGLIITITMLISWLVFFLSGMASGLTDENASAILNMDVKYFSFQKDSNLYLHRSILDEEKVSEIKSVAGVDQATAMGHYTVTLAPKGQDKQVDGVIFAIDPTSFLNPEITEGKNLTEATDNEVVVDEKLKANGFKIGDTLELKASDVKLKIIGFTKGHTYSYMPVIFSKIPVWRTAKFTNDLMKEGVPAPISVVAIQGDIEIQGKIDKQVGGIETITKDEMIQNIPGYSAMDSSIKMMIYFLCIIGALVLAVFFYVFTLQKSQAFGVLKAIGASNGYLRRTVLSQITLIAFIGVGLGIALTYGMAAMIPEGTMPFKLDIRMVVFYSLIMVVVSMLGSILSLRHISKIDPLKALGRVE